MFSTEAYQLLDFGEGRKLEQFGGVRLDRPCPTAERIRRTDESLWPSADARFERTSATSGRWICRPGLPERWTVAHGPLVFELKRSETGHVGLFPEQAESWDWIAAKVRSAEKPLRVLNLFGYTGGSTLATAAAGAEVTHVDAAQNVVAWARRNAALSGLDSAPIRWIAEDAMKFARREVKRGRRYDAVILDPPSYGHGPHGEVWRLSKHLPRMLALCAELTAGQCQFLLLSCHTSGFDPARLEALFHKSFGQAMEGSIASDWMRLCTPTGRELPSGVAVRWQAERRPNP